MRFEAPRIIRKDDGWTLSLGCWPAVVFCLVAMPWAVWTIGRDVLTHTHGHGATARVVKVGRTSKGVEFVEFEGADFDGKPIRGSDQLRRTYVRVGDELPISYVRVWRWHHAISRRGRNWVGMMLIPVLTLGVGGLMIAGWMASKRESVKAAKTQA